MERYLACYKEEGQTIFFCIEATNQMQGIHDVSQIVPEGLGYCIYNPDHSPPRLIPKKPKGDTNTAGTRVISKGRVNISLPGSGLPI